MANMGYVITYLHAIPPWHHSDALRIVIRQRFTTGLEPVCDIDRSLRATATAIETSELLASPDQIVPCRTTEVLERGGRRAGLGKTSIILNLLQAGY